MDEQLRPSARVIADSISEHGERLTTFEVQLHRFVLAEFNTHRAFSRNSASSRAIPVRREIDRVRTAPAYPLEWPAEQRGMQGGAALSGPDQAAAISQWDEARKAAIDAAERLQALGVHKSVTNRLLEPFMWQTIIVSATDWDGFFSQRCSPLAQPEIRAAAEAMRVGYHASTPLGVSADEWHLPYLQADESLDLDVAKRVAAARCARVSYLTHDGRRDLAADLELYDRLVTANPPHASPLEHVARPRRPDEPARGNFRGWTQLRHLVLTELRPPPIDRVETSQSASSTRASRHGNMLAP